MLADDLAKRTRMTVGILAWKVLLFATSVVALALAAAVILNVRFDVKSRVKAGVLECAKNVSPVMTGCENSIQMRLSRPIL